ncbi:MAG TPA: beta-propeller fold lactonase family protein [Candidatus Acidoferrales bacterium]|nr:beta-propeller fold lactonase family protein [Candidatus Acidoferrales bacterium]
MRFMRKAAFAAVLSCAVIWSSCGDTYRPIAYPNITPSPDPSTTDYVVVANNNATGPSSATIIDVSGGTNMAERRLGVGVQQLFFDASLNIFAPDPGSDAISVTTIGTVNGQQDSVQTRLLDQGSHPISLSPINYSSFLSTYIVDTGFVSPCSSSGSVRQFDLSSHVAISHNICVGPSPVYSVLSQDQSQLFVLDNDGHVYVMNTKSETTDLANPITVGSNPVYARLSLDGKYLYVLNSGSASISVIDTAFTNATTAVIATVPTGGSSPSYMTIDRQYQRLYVTNTGSNSVSMFDVTNSANVVPIQTGIPVGSAPNSLAVLKDGSKVYVSNSASNVVSVIDAVSKDASLGYRVVKSVSVGANLSDSSTRVNWVAASNDGSRVFAATTVNGDLKNATSIIDTNTDTLATDSKTGTPIFVSAPLQCDPSLGDTCTCDPKSQQCPLMRPVFVLNRVSTYDNSTATSN